MSRVMLLIPSRSYRAPDFMEAAAKLGVEVVVGSDVRSPAEELGDGRMVGLDFANPEVGAGEIERFAERHPLDTIVAVDDGGALVAARAARRLELPYNSVASVEATRNKALLRERIAGAGIASPEYRVVGTLDDAREVAASLTYPVVMKPLALSASKGVIRADDADEFVAGFGRVRGILTSPEALQECGSELADRVLIEGYIPGVEVSLEAVLDGGKLRVLAIFDKPDPLEGPYFEETIYVTPSRLAEDDQARIIETTEQACRALGLEDGPVHAELRLNSEGVYPVDIAARSIGGLCSRTLSFGTGMSLEELLLRHAIGAEVPSYERQESAAGVMMIPIPAAGTLRGVTGLAEAEAVPLIESVTISMHIGSEFTPLPEGSEYPGFIFARGETPEAVEAALRESHALLEFEIS
jgi:biotin carboxylase